jgi:hypothetical protein
VSTRLSEDPWEGMTPLQALVTEVLVARLRLGEQSWPFPVRCRSALEALMKQGLLTYDRGFLPRTLQARLTDEGRRKLTAGLYTSPLTRLAEEALFLRQNGERPPGGNENWRDWEARAETLLRSTLPPEREEGR